MERLTETGCRLTVFHLKILAMISMSVDHVGALLFPDAWYLRCVGRLAFPIFCFVLVEGCHHTGNLRRYMGRMGIFAVVSEIPYNLAFGHSLWMPEKQNVFFTLLIGLVMLWVLQQERDTVTRIGVVVLAMWAAEFLRADYGFRGILLIVIFQMTRGQAALRTGLGGAWNFLWQSRVQYAGAAAMVPIALYGGERGRKMKYFFYLFYPVHLLILYALSLWVHG